MKIIIILVCTFLMFSCSSKKNVTENKLYEILTEQADGGANIQFYELITEPKEIKMLLNDKNLKNKIQKNDIQSSNFVIVNIGKKSIGNNKIVVEKVEEINDKILITIQKQVISTEIKENFETVNPYLILKINSKKEIEFL